MSSLNSSVGGSMNRSSGVKDEPKSERSDSTPGEVLNPPLELTKTRINQILPSLSKYEKISAPVGVGVWWLDEGGFWLSFSPLEADAIFTARSAGKSEVDLGDRTGSLRCAEGRDGNGHELLYLKTATKEHLKTSEVEIRITSCALTEINHTPSYDPIESGVYWEDDEGMWHQYENYDHVRLILSSWNTTDYLVYIGKIISAKWPEGAQYAYKPSKMQQINIHTGRKRGIRIVPSARLPADFSNQELTKDSITKRLTPVSVCAFLMEEALRKVVSLEYTKIIIASQLELFKLQLVEVEFNVHLKDAGKGMFDQFLTVFEKIARKAPDSCGQLLRIIRFAREQDVETHIQRETGSCIRHVFLGAKASDLDAILKNGLKPFPSYHQLSNEWYGLDCRNSGMFRQHPYGQGDDLKFVVCLVYNVTTNPNGDLVVCGTLPTKVEHALPIAKITAKPKTRIKVG